LLSDDVLAWDADTDAHRELSAPRRRQSSRSEAAAAGAACTSSLPRRLAGGGRTAATPRTAGAPTATAPTATWRTSPSVGISEPWTRSRAVDTLATRADQRRVSGRLRRPKAGDETGLPV